MSKLTAYIQESITEMKKVTWPTKQETYHYTAMVIGISLGVAIFLFILDKLFSFGISQILIK